MRRVLIGALIGAIAGLALGRWLWRPEPVESDEIIQAREEVRAAREEAARLAAALTAVRERARIQEQQAEERIAALRGELREIAAERETLQARLDELAVTEPLPEPVADLSDDALVARLVELTETAELEPLISAPRPAVESAVMGLALASIQQQQILTLSQMCDGMSVETELLRRIISEREQQLQAVSDEREALRLRLSAEEQYSAQQLRLIGQLEGALSAERRKKKVVAAAVFAAAGALIISR